MVDAGWRDGGCRDGRVEGWYGDGMVRWRDGRLERWRGKGMVGRWDRE